MLIRTPQSVTDAGFFASRDADIIKLRGSIVEGRSLVKSYYPDTDDLPPGWTGASLSPRSHGEKVEEHRRGGDQTQVTCEQLR